MAASRRRARVLPSNAGIVETRAVAQQIVAGCREELARADSKASILIGITVGAIGLLGPVLKPLRGVASHELAAVATGWAGLATWGGALAAFTVAVFPRLKSHKSAPAYFGRISRSTTPGFVRAYVRSIALAPLRHL